MLRLRGQCKLSCTGQDILWYMPLSTGVRMARMILLFGYLQWIILHGYTIAFHSDSVVLLHLRWLPKARWIIAT
ncbi:hypothetical protein ACHAW6_006938 [Cyclotella cf. meneghiniana]